MTDELHRDELDAVLLRADDPENPDTGRTIRLRLMPWNVVATPPDTGPETFVRGAFDGIDPTRVVVEGGSHGAQLVGRGQALDQAEDAAYLDTIIARTAAGDELLELVRAGVYRDASVAFVPVPGGSRRRRDGVTERTRVDLRKVAILPRGQYPGAAVVHVRSEGDPVSEQPVPSLDEITAAVRGIVLDAIPAPVVSIPAPDPTPESVLLRAESFSDLYQRVMDGDDELLRALADEVTADVPSLVRPAWLSTIIGILPAARPVVSAFGRDELPPDGMSVNWPTFAGATDDPALRVAVQATEKAEIISAKVVLGQASSPIATYAGGLDVSWQTIKRSSPSAREVIFRVLTTAWAQVTDKAFAAALEAGATGTGAFPATPDADAVHQTLVAASAAVDDATGTPAEFVLAGSTAWLGIAGVPGLFPKTSNMYNSSGSVDAKGLQLNVSGLPIIRAKGLSPTAVIVSNGAAASWLEAGMYTAEQDVVSKLGTDVAVWSLGAPALYIPSGIVELTAAPIAFGASSSKSRKAAE